MANYMARVELHEAGPEDYERLHADMQQRGYLRDMTGEDGTIYQLPTGTYFVTNTSAMLHVALNAAVDAAKDDGQERRGHGHGLDHGSMGRPGRSKP